MGSPIHLRCLTQDERAQIDKAIQRALVTKGIVVLIESTYVGFSRNGRFTICLLETRIRGINQPNLRRTWGGACRLDPRDEDRPEDAVRLCLRKACRSMIEWVKESRENREDHPEQMVYVLHPGWVISQTDGDKHFVGFRDLIRLYGINRANCVDARNTPEDLYWVPRSDAHLCHLYPQPNGDYSLPGAENRVT